MKVGNLGNECIRTQADDRVSGVQRALGAGNSRHPPVDLNRHSQRSGAALKDSFANVMAVAAMLEHDVQVAQCVGGRCLPEVLDQFTIEFADFG